MICDRCQQPCDPQGNFCPNCGAPLQPPQKKGRHWVPMLIMAVLVLCCTALFYAVPIEADETTAGMTGTDMPWFALEKGVLYFDESKYTGGSQLTVPATINGSEVVAIGEGCFRDCETLTAIFLPETLEAIGEDAFRNCAGLRGMEIPESVAFIGKGAFSDCSALEAVCISNKLRHIGAGTFDGCSGLRYIYFLGNFPEWAALYQDFIDPTVVISCEDGKFFHDGTPN